MNIRNLPPNWSQNWEHDRVTPPAADDEEEVYTVLGGKATLRVARIEHVLEPGVFVRVGATEKRGVAAPGRAYEPLPIVELGGPTSR